ncbi:MAG: hypothetical protein E7428_08250 [Ruminococcaceae bacterium]|nr:hypothetical protein [Oscillospiraceae bacterium]
MKHKTKRITALALVLLMTASLLASCSGDGEADPAKDWPIPVYKEYVGKVIDLGLTQDEKVMDVVEVEGGIRATIGVTYEGIEETYGSHGTPYLTKYRYYGADFAEDEGKREDTGSLYEVAAYSVAANAEQAVDLVLGGDPYPRGDANYGVQYHFYRDGQATENIVIPPEMTDSSGGLYTYYGARAHIMPSEDAFYAGIKYSDMDPWKVYINGHFLEVTYPDTNQPSYTMDTLCGLIGINGKPYALVRRTEETRDSQVVNVVGENARLVPLTPETTELPLEGIDIEGVPTGGAFSDGMYGYFFCEGELWRTDGKKSTCIADLTSFGVGMGSEIRAVRVLSDGRILVVSDGQLLRLTGKEVAGEADMEANATGGEKTVFTIGVVNDYWGIDDLVLTASKFKSDNVTFTVKNFRDRASMNLAMLSGEVDMVVTRDLFLLKNYVKQGMLAPLEEVAPELFEEGVLIENIVDAARVNGTCYFLPREFYIRGQQTEARFMEAGQTFETREEFCDFLAREEVGFLGGPILKRDAFMELAQDLDEWIDWETNTAHFDGEKFKAVLEFCNKAATQEEMEAWSMAPTNMYYSNFLLQDTIQSNNFDNVDDAKAYLAGIPEDQWDSNWAWVRFPLPSTVYDGYEILAAPYFAVVDQEDSRKAAGEFLRWHFMEDVEEFTADSWASMISINREEADRYLKRNIKAVENIEIDPSMSQETQEAMEEINEALDMRQGVEQYLRTWEVIHQADHFQYFRNEIYDVMQQEAGRYFDGDITLDQAADYIQNRISIFLAEQS